MEAGSNAGCKTFKSFYNYIPVNESGGLEEPLLFPRKDMEIINLKQFVNAKEKAVVQWLSLIDTGQVLAHIPCQMRMQCIYLFNPPKK